MEKKQEKAYAWAEALCRYAGADEAFFQDFWRSNSSYQVETG